MEYRVSCLNLKNSVSYTTHELYQKVRSQYKCFVWDHLEKSNYGNEIIIFQDTMANDGHSRLQLGFAKIIEFRKS